MARKPANRRPVAPAVPVVPVGPVVPAGPVGPVAKASRLKRLCNLQSWPLAAVLALAGMFGVVLAVVSVDLVQMTTANLSYFERAGIMAVLNGAAVQLLGLGVKGFVGLMCFLGFKICETEVVRRYRRWQGW